ncbi:MAG: ABC transporter permease [Acidimicrobiia bacterium]|nr:ABC transporter permease [Acidimicrobiia bacterium]
MKQLSNFVQIWPPLVATAIALGSWEFLLWITQPDGFVLPPPTEIAAAVGENFATITTATRVTGFIIVTGLVAGVLLGITAALLVTTFRTANETITPLAVAINAIPIVALAPIFNFWFGLLSPRSNQAVVVALVFFPIVINTARGLTEVEPSQIELMESYGVRKWRIIREVRIPNAMPFFFTALKLATSLAVIAAIVAEYFGGRQDALGNIITSSAGLTRYADAWAAVLAGSLLGIVLYGVAVLAERVTMPWYFLARRS